MRDTIVIKIEVEVIVNFRYKR